MAHFFKYANRVMHAGASKERDERGEKMRQAGIKAGNGQSSVSELPLAERHRMLRERMAQREQEKKNKRSAINKTLKKNQ